ncbi:MFS transporter [Microbacterium sp. GXF7504]
MSDRDESSAPGAAAVLGRFAPMIYGPTILFALGEGAVIPLIPVIAERLGADITLAAVVVSALTVGQLMGNLPAGALVARIGERLTMAGAGSLVIVATAGALWAPNLAVFAAAVLLVGVSASAFGLARHAFMTTRVPLHFRARALSLLGGSFRLGIFIGPFVSAALLAVFPGERAPIWFFAGCSVLVVLLVLFGPDPETSLAAELEADRARAGSPSDARASVAASVDAEDSGEPVTGSIPTAGRAGVFRTMWRHRTVLSRLGVAAASLSATRAARQAILPLWGLSIGLDGQTIALVVGVSGAIDFALFYASGQVMDRFGRLWAALPSMVLMGGGFLALSFTHDLGTAAMWFAMFAAVLGVGNGLSSGILLTLGADVAPKDDPAPFLGSWRTLTDAGGAAAPLLVSGITAALSLSWAAGAMGVVALLGAGAFVRWVPRFVPRAR